MDLSLLFDTHLHVCDTDHPVRMFERARKAGVGYFLIAGTDLESTLRAAEIASVDSGVMSTAGVHPHQAAAFEGSVGPFRELIRSQGAIAVGEIGLDYHYDHSPREVQRDLFRCFLELAQDEKVPIVIHCRDAFEDCLDILGESLDEGYPFEIHSYTGSVDVLEEFLKLGAYVSFNGMVTFRRARNIRENLCLVPLDRLFVETDSPYLAPVPYRGKTNCPAYLPATVDRIATERGVPYDQIVRRTTENAVSFFGLCAPASRKR